MELLDDGKNLLHQQRRQAHGGLIHQHNAGIGHQGPAGGQHLLLAAGEGARQLLPALLQPGEVGIDLFQILVDFMLILQDIGPHAQVFLHGHAGKHMASFRHMGQAHVDDLMGRRLLQVLPVQGHGAGGGSNQAGDGVQGGGFAGAVGADEGDQLPFPHAEGDALQGVDGPVKHVQIFDFKHGLSLLIRPDRRR